MSAAALHLRLRDETASRHQTLEDRLDLLSPILDRDRYGIVLARFATIYASLEEQIDGALADWPELRDELQWAQRRKAPLLDSDLRHLGIEPARVDLINLVTNADEALGVLYVMEGATLGARLMRPHMEALLAPDRAGVAFFTGYGESGPAMWSSFRAVLSAHEGDEQAVVNGALATFDTFLNAFDDS
jgi:heme oxygenase